MRRGDEIMTVHRYLARAVMRKGIMIYGNEKSSILNNAHGESYGKWRNAQRMEESAVHYIFAPGNPRHASPK